VLSSLGYHTEFDQNSKLSKEICIKSSYLELGDWKQKRPTPPSTFWCGKGELRELSFASPDALKNGGVGEKGYGTLSSTKRLPSSSPHTHTQSITHTYQLVLTVLRLGKKKISSQTKWIQA